MSLDITFALTAAGVSALAAIVYWLIRSSRR